MSIPVCGKTKIILTYHVIVILVILHFGFEGWTLVLIASVPGHCLPFTSNE